MIQAARCNSVAVCGRHKIVIDDRFCLFGIDYIVKKCTIA
jgi:hypothetical protein